MRKFKSYAIFAMAALMSVFIFGCECNNDECGAGDVNSSVIPLIHRPTVTFVTPYNTEIGVPINTAVTATFSEAMNDSTIDETTFLVTGPGLVPVPVIGGVTYDAINHIAIFDPAIDLLPNTTYVATITTGAENPAGASLEVPFVWIFTTGVAADITNPTVILTNPANLAPAAPINTAVTAAFSEAMNSTSITALGTFTLKLGLINIPGSVTYIGGIATFTPTLPLAYNTTYIAEITTAATDLAGNPLVAGLVPNPWTFTTGSAPDIINPTVILTNPANLAVGVPVSTAVTATFSEAMLPGTIIGANFTLTGPGLTPVLGTVGYSLLTHVGTFTPLAPLAINTTYTATITSAATDLAGNPLVAGLIPNPWTFTTPKVLSPLLVDLGAAAPFAALSGSGISDVPLSTIVGDIGVSPGTGASITGLTCGEVTGTIYTVDAAGPACRVIDVPGLAAAKLALTAAYNFAAGQTVPAPATVSGDQGGTTLFAGIYKSTSSLSIASGNLTLDAQGDINAVWIFQIASTLTTVGCGASVPCATGGNVFLINGANAANVFWQVGSDATIGQFTAFEGTILSSNNITVNTGAYINGRLLAGATTSPLGAITLISDTIIMP